MVQADNRFRTWRKVATAVALLLLAGSVYPFIEGYNQEVRYSTGYGNTRKIELPDGSLVTLNGNYPLSSRIGMESRNNGYSAFRAPLTFFKGPTAQTAPGFCHSGHGKHRRVFWLDSFRFKASICLVVNLIPGGLLRSYLYSFQETFQPGKVKHPLHSLKSSLYS